MSNHKEGVNPLRPYYIPPTIGQPAEAPVSSSPGGLPNERFTGKYAPPTARDIFSDIDYKDYLSQPSPSVVQSVRQLIDELLWKYTSVLMAQPFEVAKTILQVRLQDDVGALEAAIESTAPKPSSSKSATYDEYAESDSDADEPAYFSSDYQTHSPDTPTPSHRRRRTRTPSSSLENAQSSSGAGLAPHQLALRRPDSVLAVISQLWQKEGAWGVWKGSNATFIYTVLQSLLENWSRSLLSALFNVPDVGLSEDIDRMVSIAAPYPWVSLFVAATAAVATGLVLAPLDLVRMRLLVTSTSSKPRRTLSALRALPSYIIPSTLILPTMLHSLLHPVLTLSTPLVLRTRFMIDRELSPMTFSVVKFCSSSLALLVKLPLETVLRRGQVAVLASPAYTRALNGPGARHSLSLTDDITPPRQLEAVVPLGQYRGVTGTMYAIVSEEGSRQVKAPKSAATTRGRGGAATTRRGKAKVAETVYRRGQGLEGLWRGWKVSWWGLVGLWGAGIFAGGGDGEF